MNITAQFSLDILMIQYWVLLLACLSVSDHTHMNGLNQIGVSANLKQFKRVYSSMSRHVQSVQNNESTIFWEKAEVWSWITAQKMKFPIKDLFSKCEEITEEIYWRNP